MIVTWRKAARSNTSGGNCVEIAALADAIGVRDSKDPGGPVMLLSRSEFGRFVRLIRTDHHDRPLGG